jgi:hypothetical protein
MGLNKSKAFANKAMNLLVSQQRDFLKRRTKDERRLSSLKLITDNI